MTEHQATNFTDLDLLKGTIKKYLTEKTDAELAGEVFDILDNVNKKEIWHFLVGM